MFEKVKTDKFCLKSDVLFFLSVALLFKKSAVLQVTQSGVGYK